jgi:hypothetical protein
VLLLPVIIALGLGSRARGAAEYLPRFLTDYAGDTLWATLVYLGLVVVRPRLPVRRAAAGALGFSVLIELSQLFHPPWLDALRAHRLVALVLGRGFLASDLVCYAVGVGLGVGLDVLLLIRRADRKGRGPGTGPPGEVLSGGSASMPRTS